MIRVGGTEALQGHSQGGPIDASRYLTRGCRPRMLSNPLRRAPMSEEEPLTVTKKQLVNRIAEQTRQTKVVVKGILQQFLDEIIDELSRGNRLEFREFGVFEVRERAARKAHT